ncbi:DJ-1/PfpI family protein [Paenibacillus doosanensis]|uniref:Isonitrile hydratase n=1 Tax=Paenibacillus konkukensis TaxID=2020716 RepID=A0ABY4RRK3_9BACL|nr:MULTISPECIES: DJ-1/PfpI family protein [Paenibacillus]MCS7459079.1 DJ-1/PfpI family protein [Paenibacillus doosanensis]UQZ84133.1 Isonitrile hydratase [Paenibacillus konkukensis]
MGTIVCFISEEFADFEITLALHKIKNVGRRTVMTAGYELQPVVSESGLFYMPDRTVQDALRLDDIEALIIPGGPIREQREELTALIRKLDEERTLLAAICNGPQYLGRAGVLDGTDFTTSCSPERIQALGVQDPFPRRSYVNRRVVRSGHIITAQGRAFVDFSFALFDYLNIYEGQQGERDKLYRDIMNR